jgi:hypothetical protein
MFKCYLDESDFKVLNNRQTDLYVHSVRNEIKQVTSVSMPLYNKAYKGHEYRPSRLLEFAIRWSEWSASTSGSFIQV